jgi:type I restriction enzyme M protein
LLGAAYEYLVYEFAESAGKKGGEFYTPRSVVRMMVRLVDPAAGMRVYDPCCGSGGMLIYAKLHVEEHGGDASDLSLYGQDNNGSAWAICKMNLFLHGIAAKAFIDNDDTLKNPAFTDPQGGILRFDRVLSNPPFSMNYEREGTSYPERFPYGWAPDSGKKADWMFAQHMLASLRPKGVMATVMPHGVLFRGGKELAIRRGLLAADTIEAIISLPPNLFYGTGIPACILVMRRPGEKPVNRRGQVLFINADREFEAGRAQNYLRPEHVEKILTAFAGWQTLDGFSRLVTLEEIAANDHNLNIRRYVDNAPPPEPQDVRAHLLGGVPHAEIAALQPLFAAHGLDAALLLVDRDAAYCDFAASITDQRQLATVAKAAPAVRAREQALLAAFAAWWSATAAVQLRDLPQYNNVMKLRAGFIASFQAALEPVGLLDPFKIVGVLVTWWDDSKDEFKTVAAGGFAELVDGWIDFIRDMLDDADSRRKEHFDPFAHKLVRKLLPDYLREIEDTRAEITRLEGEIAAFEAGPEDEDGGDEGEESRNYVKELETEIRALQAQLAGSGVKAKRGRRKANVEPDLLAPESQSVYADIAALEAKLDPYRELKRQLTGARRQLRELGAALLQRLNEQRAALDEAGCGELALAMSRDDLAAILGEYVAAHWQEVVDALGNLWEKYNISLSLIDSELLLKRNQLSESLYKSYLQGMY